MVNLAGRTFRSIPLLVLLPFALMGCLDEGSGNEDTTQVVAEPGETPTAPYTPPERTVCDPFSGGASAQDRGLVGHLLYLTDDQPRYSQVADYIENAIPVESTLYFDRIFVPTRGFDRGFYTQTGEVVVNLNNEPVYEYFALRLESQLTLAANEPEGWYQMAILSDDGAVLSEKNADGSLSTIVDNDGNHPTRMGCSAKAIYMDHDTKKDVVLAYHQGPRYHIALTVMWRPLPEGADPLAPVDDLECGQSGNSRYFDSTQVPSEPQLPYYELLERNWKPLNNENYYFPAQASNPCAEAEPLLLTNFSLNSVTRTDVTVSWATSLPSSSQLVLKNVGTGVVTSSAVSDGPRTSHQLTLSGLERGTLYSIKAVSQSADGQIVESSESAFRTPR